MTVTTVPRVNAPAADESLVAKATKAGAQFEAILLNMVFGDLERTFTQLPGAMQNGVSQSYSNFAVESLTSGLARAGGVGLGAFITKSLIAHSKHQS